MARGGNGLRWHLLTEGGREPVARRKVGRSMALGTFIKARGLERAWRRYFSLFRDES